MSKASVSETEGEIMNQQPMEQFRGAKVNRQPDGQSFAMPARKMLSNRVKWRCSHCGTENNTEQVVLYYWPDRKKGEKSGYVASCISCGCRHMIQFKAPPKPIPDPEPEPEPKPKPLLLILLGAMGVLTLVVGLSLASTFLGRARPVKPVSPTSESSVSSSASQSASSSGSVSGTASVVKTQQEEPAEQTRSEYLDDMGFAPISEEITDSLPENVYAGEWKSKRKVQGVTWNTDTMETVYFSIASYIVSCNKQGKILEEIPTKGYFFSVDYYDGHVFSVWRSPDYGTFKLKVYNADTLDEECSVKLADMHEKFKDDEEAFGGDLCASIDAVMVAPRIGSQDELMVYVSYNSYVSVDDGISRNEDQVIYEYSYDDVMNKKTVTSKRRLSLDLGAVQYGIQTLELDRSTGNIWCAIRQGYSDYSLYLIDGSSRGSRLQLIPNGDRSGWDCPAAGDGLCSLGNDKYYVLIPHSNDGWVSVEARSVRRENFESINRGNGDEKN